MFTSFSDLGFNSRCVAFSDGPARYFLWNFLVIFNGTILVFHVEADCKGTPRLKAAYHLTDLQVDENLPILPFRLWSL